MVANPKFPILGSGEVLRNAVFRVIGGVVVLGTSESDLEEVEGTLLERGGSGDLVEGGPVGDLGLEAVLNDGSQVVQ